jgi:hypothetical protein
MKLHQNPAVCKQSFYNHKVSTVLYEGHPLSRPRLNHANEHSAQLKKYIQNPESASQIELSFTDAVGRVRPLILGRGNICLVGADEDSVFALSHNIWAQLVASGKKATIISFEQYVALPAVNRFSLDHTYLVEVSSDCLDTIMFKHISYSFISFMVFAVKQLRLECPLNGYVHRTGRINELIASFGGNFLLRQYLLASLRKGEFLVADRKHETIRTIN